MTFSNSPFTYPPYSQVPSRREIIQRDPGNLDIQNWRVGDEWFNPVNFSWWKFNGPAATPVWEQIGGITPGIEKITGNSGSVTADANDNVNLLGTGPLSFSGSGSTMSGSVAEATTSSVGVASFNPSYFNVTTGNVSLNSSISLDSLLANSITATSSMSTPQITISNAPVNGTDGANKTYVDEVASGFTFVDGVFAATTANLTSTYNNGSSGVGATLTNSGTQAAFSVDGTSPSVNARILVKNQSTQFQNGVYSLTTVGSISTNWVLTRTTDYDTVPPIAEGNLIPVQNGTVNQDTIWLQTFNVVTIGTDPIVFQAFNAPSLTTQTCFSAYLATNLTNQTGNGTAVTVIYGTRYFDNANAYNTSTGIYTAPSTGIYVFGSNVTIGSTSSVPIASVYENNIMQNGVAITKFSNQGSVGPLSSFQSIFGTTLISATLGDQISTQCLATGQGSDTLSIIGTGTGKETEFWGYRIA